MIKRIPSLFGIIAALFVIIIGFVTGRTAYEIIIRLVYIIIIAYCAGFLLRFYLLKKVFPEKDEEQDESSLDEPSGLTGNEDEHMETAGTIHEDVDGNE